jgi:hypothetical protein
VPRRSKHPLLTGYTRRAPLVEINYTGLPIVKASMGMKSNKLYETNNPAYGPVVICNRKQGHYSDRRICEMVILNEIHYNLAT